MKKALPITVVAILIVGGLYFATYKSSDNAPQTTQQGTQTQATTWKTYTDADTGFTFKYPSQYTVEASPAPTSDWGSRSLLIVDDNPGSTSSKPRSVPMTVGLQKQPVAANGKIYHTIAEYQQSGTAAQMVQGVSNPNGELTTVNGMQALLYHIPPADSTGIGGDSYFFIKDDLIYEVGINPNDPLAIEMLKSISWSK